MNNQNEMLRSLRIDRGSENAAARGVGLLAVLGIGLVSAVLAGAGVWFLKPGAEPGAQGRPATQTAQGADGNAASTPASVAAAGGLTASGYVVARRRATVAAEVIGRVIEVRVEEGQTVRKGEVLALLDASLAQAEYDGTRARVRSAEADITATRAELAEARLVLSRAEQLVASKFASEASVTAARARVDSLAGRVAQAEANRTAFEREAARASGQLARYVIRAPFSGVVVDKAAQAGEIISPSSAGGGFTRTGICSLVDMDSLEIEVDVNEAYIARVSPGQPVQAVLDAYPELKLPARVIAAIPTASRDKATVRVRVGFDKLDPRILPEMAIKVTFIEGNPRS